MRDKIKLVSSAGTGHYYTTDKNKRSTPDKLELKKYDPVVRKHVIYKEAKLSKGLCRNFLKSRRRREESLPFLLGKSLRRLE